MSGMLNRLATVMAAIPLAIVVAIQSYVTPVLHVGANMQVSSNRYKAHINCNSR